ncbi:hypothetical protein [Maritimibacter sp. UBA3975]|uniref:DUF6958 family protein n=1 Tax=Maritimibacter sp. UBA3975 TaxID=1946833 RepID=UPI000C0ABFB8|nr:hypothetical protein [Maritimibacter sp. UBA3975]MAM61884.1 hypothetical protein [Maritimibacter sp.]|tara:strand:- start:2436 stop:2729 length:294 start_codon:yes stop_codon:yes gene_type:complete
MSEDKVEVRNINSPDHITRVDRVKYEDMKQALMQVLPSEAPGIKVAEAQDALKPLLDQALFPGGAKSGWWLKCVQLDLEFKGEIKRADKPPVRLYRV